MKLLFFSPLGSNSSIGGVTLQLVEHLQMEQNVEVHLINTRSSNSRDLGLSIQHTSFEDSDKIKSYLQKGFVPVYQIGNSYENHKGLFPWVFNVPGISILHDFYLADLYRGYLENHASTKELDEFLRKSFVDNRNVSQKQVDANLDFVQILKNSSTVITHNLKSKEVVERHLPCRVLQAGLTHNKKFVSQTILNTNADQYQFHILTVGHMNSNKCILEMISALMDICASSKYIIKYTLAGHITTETSIAIHRMVENSSLIVKILGEVDNFKLHELLCEADLVSCLRTPIFETASGSLLESLLYGKATLVLNSGYYAEIPDDIVFKVSLDKLSSDIENVLNSMTEQRKTNLDKSSEISAYAQNISNVGNYILKIREAYQNHFGYLASLVAIENLNSLSFGMVYKLKKSTLNL